MSQNINVNGVMGSGNVGGNVGGNFGVIGMYDH